MTSLKENFFEVFSSGCFLNSIMDSTSILIPIKSNKPKATHFTTIEAIWPACSPARSPAILSMISTSQKPIKGIKACMKPKVPAIKNDFFLLISVYVKPSVKATEKASIAKPKPKKKIVNKICQVILLNIYPISFHWFSFIHDDVLKHTTVFKDGFL